MLIAVTAGQVGKPGESYGSSFSVRSLGTRRNGLGHRHSTMSRHAGVLTGSDEAPAKIYALFSEP